MPKGQIAIGGAKNHVIVLPNIKIAKLKTAKGASDLFHAGTTERVGELSEGARIIFPKGDDALNNDCDDLTLSPSGDFFG